MVYRYKTIKRDGKTKLLHRHIAEQKLGRPLRPDEHVHHGNEERWDNRPSNIEVLPAEEHLRLHADERLVHPRTKTCEVCGVVFTPHRTKRKRAKTCSRQCGYKLRWITRRLAEADVQPLMAANYSDVEQRQAA